MGSYCVIITTFPNERSAKDVTYLLLEKKLAACVQMNAIQSFYHWEGSLCEEPEQCLVIKTRSSLFEAIQTLLLEYHPYELPEIIQIPIERGLEAYLDWLEMETTFLHVKDELPTKEDV